MTVVAYSENSGQHVLPDGFFWHSDCTKFNFGRGPGSAPDLHPGPLWGAYDTPKTL